MKSAVSVNLSLPKVLGGAEMAGTTTPEHLFAAGYAARFGSALDYVGKQYKKDATRASVTCSVSIGPREGGGFGLCVRCASRTGTCPRESSPLW